MPISAYDKTIDMNTVTVSPKLQVGSPQAIRQRLRLRLEPAAKMAMFDAGGHIELVPITPARELPVLRAGIDTPLPDQPDRF